jgi:hypothetical protein
VTAARAVNEQLARRRIVNHIPNVAARTAKQTKMCSFSNAF